MHTDDTVIMPGHVLNQTVLAHENIDKDNISGLRALSSKSNSSFDGGALIIV